MTKRYLKVHIEGPGVHDEVTKYEELEDYLDEDGEPTWTEDEVLARAQDIVNEVYSWGHEVLTEDQVPEGDR